MTSGMNDFLIAGVSFWSIYITAAYVVLAVIALATFVRALRRKETP